MKEFLKKYLLYFVLAGIMIFFWYRYRVAPHIEFAETVVKDINGKEVVLGNLLDKPSVVHFYATWCGPCMGEFRTLKSRIPYLESQGLNFIFITDDTTEKIKTMQSTLPATVQFYRVEKLQDLGIYTIPASYFINSHGEAKKKIVDVCNWENDDFCAEIISITQ